MDHSQPRRKTIKHFHQPGDLHELTVSCYRRLPLLTNDTWRGELSNCISEADEEFSFEFVAFVYLPEHVHLLVFPLSDNPEIDKYLARIKQPLSKFVKSRLVDSSSPLLNRLTIRERPGKHGIRFWQEGPGFNRNLFTLKAIQASIDYRHRNPVERGLCQRAVDWKWSSARYYLSLPPKQPFSHLAALSGLRADAIDRGQPR